MPKRSTSTSDSSRDAKSLKVTREEEKKRAREWALNQKSNKKVAVDLSPKKSDSKPSSNNSSAKNKSRKELLDARAAEIAAAQSWVQSQNTTEISAQSSSKKLTSEVRAPKGRQSRKLSVESVPSPSPSPSPSPPPSPERRQAVSSSSSSIPKSKPRSKSQSGRSYDSNNDNGFDNGDEDVSEVEKSSGGGLNLAKPILYINSIGRQISSMLVFCSCILFFFQWIYISYIYYTGKRVPVDMLLDSGTSVVGITFLFFVPFLLMVVPSYMMKQAMKFFGKYIGEGVAAFAILVIVLIYFPCYGISNWGGVWPF